MVTEKKLINRLFRNDPATPEGKYLVKRRDGTVPEWPFFVLGASDPSAPAALRAYADDAERRRKLLPGIISDIRALANEFYEYRLEHGAGDPERGPHRTDDPVTIAEMRKGRGS